MYLSWEELPEDEQPPERIWDDPKLLKEHFAAVKRKREAEQNPDAIKQPIDDPQQNDAARLLLDDGR